MPLVIDSELPPVGIAVGEHGSLHVAAARWRAARRVRVEEGLVVELEDGEVDAARDGDHGGADLVAVLAGLDLHLAGIAHHVRVGQDALALDDHARAGGFLRRCLGPGLQQVGAPHGGENLHHRALRAVRDGRGRFRGGRRGDCRSRVPGAVLVRWRLVRECGCREQGNEPTDAEAETKVRVIRKVGLLSRGAGGWPKAASPDSTHFGARAHPCALTTTVGSGHPLEALWPAPPSCSGYCDRE